MSNLSCPVASYIGRYLLLLDLLFFSAAETEEDLAQYLPSCFLLQPLEKRKTQKHIFKLLKNAPFAYVEVKGKARK